MTKDEKYMEQALDLAEEAFRLGETPIGCVVVYKDQIIGRGYNRRNMEKNPLYHAEIIAINEAASFIGDWRLEECIIYITLEPCPMCAGAIVQSRIEKAVIAATNPKAGCAGSILNILQEPKFNHQIDVVTGILAEKSSNMLKKFFKNLRCK